MWRGWKWGGRTELLFLLEKVKVKDNDAVDDVVEKFICRMDFYGASLLCSDKASDHAGLGDLEVGPCPCKVVGDRHNHCRMQHNIQRRRRLFRSRRHLPNISTQVSAA